MESSKRGSLNNRHYVWCLLLLGLLGVLSYFRWSTQVFPSASIDLKMSSGQAKALALDWSKRLGFETSGTVRSTIFAYDDGSKTFLEYELGGAKANQLMRERIPVWYWSTRICRPLKLEEISVALSPSGQLVSFDHSIENDRSLPSLTHDAARQLVISFIEQSGDIKLADYKSVEDGTVSHSHRLDHYFAWEDTTASYNGARLRVFAQVSGNTITSYTRFLYIPETWLRKYSELRSYNKALEEVASIFYLAFNTATFFVFVWAFTSGLLRWKFAAIIAAGMAAIDFLESINAMPRTIHAYATTMSYNSFMVDTYVSATISAVSQAAQIFVLVGAAEALYRLAFPAKVAVEQIFRKAGLISRETLTGLLAGYGMFGIHLGWVIIYYLMGRPLGFWSPLEMTNIEVLSSTVPAFSAMYVGLLAGIGEELMYRVLGMSLFQRVTGKFWIANLLQAAAWAFMHSNYPQEPPYARGLELTVVGVFYGFMLRKFGLLACIVSHYVFDAFLGVTALFSSSLLSLRMTALIAVTPFLVLLVAGYVLYRKHKDKQDLHALTNAEVPKTAFAAPIEEVLPVASFHYQPLSSKARLLVAAFLGFAVYLQFFFFFPTVGGHAQLLVNREEAVRIARQYLLERKIVPDRYIHTVWLSKGLNSQEMQYLFEKTGQAKTAKLATVPGRALVWRVRFFQAMDPQEYVVLVDYRGRVISFGIVAPEDATGASLDQTVARNQVETYLNNEHPELKPYTLQASSESRKKARKDYTFRYTVPQFTVAEAPFKVFLDTVGSVTANFDQQWELPDAWLWERARQRPKDLICTYIIYGCSFLIVVASVWWAYGLARSVPIQWRAVILLSGTIVLVVIPQALNDLPEFFVGYGTDTPLLSYVTAQTVRQVITAITSMSIVGALTAFALASFRLLSPRVRVASILGATLAEESAPALSNKWNIWLDAVLVGYAAGLGYRALSVILALVHSKWSPVVTLAPLESFSTLANVASPALDVFIEALTTGLQTTLGAAILAGLYAKYFRNFRGYLLFTLAFSLIFPSPERYWQDYVTQAAGYLITGISSWFLVTRLSRFNLLAYFFAGVSNHIAGSLRVLIAHGQAVFLNDIILLDIVLFSPLFYLVYLRSKRISGRDSVTGDEAGEPPANDQVVSA